MNAVGCINASDSTLTIGISRYHAGNLTGFRDINIEAQGLDTRDTDYTRIFSQTAQINIPI